MATPGLKFLCRDSVALPGNRIDHPLSSRFDEQDAFVIFNDVEVPRERVFIDGDVALHNAVIRHSWWPNIMQHAMVRAEVKLHFAWALGTLMTETLGAAAPEAQRMLGEIWTFAELARAGIRAAEADARDWGNGVWACDVRPLIALRTSLPRWFPRVNDIIRELGAHNHLTTPTTGQLANPDLRPLLDRYLHGAHGIDAARRARVFRLAWDFVGTALASRNEQYRAVLYGIGRAQPAARAATRRSHPGAAPAGTVPGRGGVRQGRGPAGHAPESWRACRPNQVRGRFQPS